MQSYMRSEEKRLQMPQDTEIPTVSQKALLNYPKFCNVTTADITSKEKINMPLAKTDDIEERHLYHGYHSIIISIYGANNNERQMYDNGLFCFNEKITKIHQTPRSS
uniref:Uncharacterized protein n=1 Tax=Glossina pallidipes TaxID=7398 RepID=A0A1A9ZY48_GLOPL